MKFKKQNAKCKGALCLCVSNNFGVLQKRFAKELGKDVVLLTITFDPQRDTPEALAAYAAQWTPAPKTWHFLTGPVRDVRRGPAERSAVLWCLRRAREGRNAT